MSGYPPRPGFPGGGFQQSPMPPLPPGASPAYSAMPAPTAQNSHQPAGYPPGPPQQQQQQHHQQQHQQQQMSAFSQPSFPSPQHQMANGGIPNGFPGMHQPSNAPNRVPQPPTMPPSAFQQPQQQPRPQTNGFGNNYSTASTAPHTGNFGPPLNGPSTMPNASPPDPSPHAMHAPSPFPQQSKPLPPAIPNQSLNTSQTSNFQPTSAMSNGPSLPRPPLPMPPVPGIQQSNFGQQQRPGFPPPVANMNQPQPQQQQQGHGQSYPGGPMQPQMPQYPGGGYGQQQQPVNAMSQDFNRMGMGPPAGQQYQQQYQQMVDLMQERQILTGGCPDPQITLPPTVINSEVNCDPDVFRCTLSAIPQTQELLKKCRLPLGLTLHPFRDMKNLNVINTSTIVRCRACRTYINPFVQLPDQRHWKCNLCFRVNDLPDEFMWDPVTKSFGDPVRRPEIKYATVEFIAPGEYMPVRKNLQGNNELRPPQAAVYVFILDVSASAVESGYLHAFSEQFLINLDQMPGDNRTMMAFIAVDNGVHFFEFSHKESPPKQIIATDVDDIFIPTTGGLLVNLAQWKEEIRSFVQSLPTVFESNQSTSNALGAALTVAHEMIADLGGRITVITTTRPDIGPGALKSREDPNQRAANEVENLGLATDFYKRLSLECTGHQVAMDLFMLNSKYADLATLSEMSKYGGGNVYHFPNYHILREPTQVKRFEKTFCRYLTRKIGFEAVLRIRCTKGLALHTFHGNFFVRSTDLLAVPNINPDTAMGVQVQMEENLTGLQSVCFQAALLYTSSKGDRRIRVHTMCLPVTTDIPTVHNKIDIKCVISMLAKMAVERSIAAGGSLNDAREAMVNAAVDAIGAFNRSIPGSRGAASLLAPSGGLRLFPLYVLGLLKHPAFVLGRSVKLDDRLAAMCMFKTAPIKLIMLEVYPALYPLHTIETQPDDPPELQLSYERVDRHGVYLLDCGSYMYLYVGQAVSDVICQQLFGVPHFSQIDEDNGLPELATAFSDRVRAFIRDLGSKRPFYAPLRVIREDSASRELVTRRLIEDRTESSHSYVEFLQHVRKEVAR